MARALAAAGALFPFDGGTLDPAQEAADGATRYLQFGVPAG